MLSKFQFIFDRHDFRQRILDQGPKALSEVCIIIYFFVFSTDFLSRNKNRRKAASRKYYENKGSAARKAKRERIRLDRAIAAAHEPTPDLESEEEALALTTVKRYAEEVDVWMGEFGGSTKSWRKLKRDGDNEEELEKHAEIGKSLFFQFKCLYDHYEPPNTVAEAMEIHQLTMTYRSKLSAGMSALK